MLREIRCDKFNEKTIIFNYGLNVVLGDDVATNSIGKSTMLMIIDFVFGGDTYITSNQDAIQNLGHHEFQFSFVFDKTFFFSRSTKEYKYVNLCNEKFETIEQVKVSEFTTTLKQKYQIGISDISFRDIVGRYSRIWGKENLDIAKPLQYFHKETNKSSIITLVKLFNKYESIKDFEQQITRLEEEKGIILKAAKIDFIPKMTKTLFKDNIKNIEGFNKELEVLKHSILEISLNVEALVSKEILELKNIKSQLMKENNIYESRLSRTRKNLSNKKLKISEEFHKLKEYFKDINTDKLEEIEVFHSTITSILKDELKKTEKEVINKILYLSNEIEQIDKTISEKLNLKNAPQYAVDRVIELSAKIRQLESENVLYEKSKVIMDDLKQAKEDLVEIKSDILINISSQINTKMHEINKVIYPDNRRSPIFDVREASYTFKTFSDTGTGTAYANLITFDLALLSLTELPLLVHDLPLFKNIENVAMKNIVRLYNANLKQTFIAIDEIHKFSSEIRKILRDKSAVKLSKDKTLFIKNWKNENAGN